MAHRVVLKAVDMASDFWERFQVELHGRCSVATLESFLRYAKSASSLRVAAVLVFTAIPSAIVVVLNDVLPLQPPTAGLAGQTTTYLVRVLSTALVLSSATLAQWSQASARLPVRPWQLLWSSFAVTFASALAIYGVQYFVAFPAPFLFQVLGIPWQLSVVSVSWIMWKDAVRSDPEIRADLARYLHLWSAQVAMVLVYPGFSYIFGTLAAHYQTIFTSLLPLWKILLRNWCSYGSFRREEFAPVIVVFSVEVFHSLFLASAMRSSSSSGSSTLAVVMAVDVIQGCIAVYEVVRVRTTIRAIGMQIDAAEDPTKSSPPMTCSFERSAYILASSLETREHPTVAEPRHRQPASQSSSNVGTRASLTVRIRSSLKVAAFGLIPDESKQTSRVELAHQQLEQSRREYVRANLKLLYMVEFYMLIEFTEVAVTVIYAVYLLAMAHLPNRRFYLPLKNITDAQFNETVEYVVQYAALEMLSFFLLATVLSTMLRISTMRQLAFVLEKHWLLAQSFLVLWVFLPTQMSLEHIGT